MHQNGPNNVSNIGVPLLLGREKKKARGGDGKVFLFPSSAARLLNKSNKADFTVGNIYIYIYIYFVTNISEGTRAYYFLLEIPSGSPFAEERE